METSSIQLGWEHSPPMQICASFNDLKTVVHKVTSVLRKWHAPFYAVHVANLLGGIFPANCDISILL